MNARYEVVAGLKPLKYEKEGDLTFEIDSLRLQYREAKINIQKTKDRDLYFPKPAQLSALELDKVCRFIAARLCLDYPQLFVTEGTVFKNLVDNESIDLESCDETTFHALSLCVQEDVAIWKMDAAAQKEWLAALHVCFPSGWDPSEKIGKSFVSVHLPVVDFDSIAKNSWAMVETMVKKGPFSRYVWGIAFDNCLDHHPENRKKLPSFNSEKPQVFVRVERQTLHPFPNEGVSLFTIRTYVYNIAELSKEVLEPLYVAVKNMTPDQQKYKGIQQYHTQTLAYMEQLLKA